MGIEWARNNHNALKAIPSHRGGPPLVLADTRRLVHCFPAADYFEHRRIPFVVAVNCFAGARTYGAHEVSRALDLDRGTPVVLCDARDHDSGKEVLVRLVEYASRMHTVRLLDSVGWLHLAVSSLVRKAYGRRAATGNV